MTKYDNERPVPIVQNEFMGFDLHGLIVLDARKLDHDHPISFDRAKRFLEREFVATLTYLLHQSSVKGITPERFKSFLEWVQEYARERQFSSIAGEGSEGTFLWWEPVAIVMGDYGFSSLHDEGIEQYSSRIVNSGTKGLLSNAV